LHIGSTDTVSLSGTWTQTSAGTLAIDVGGTAQFGLLSAASTGSDAGTLATASVNGFNPVVGATFKVMTCSACSGTFSTVTGNYNAVYHAADVTIVALQAPKVTSVSPNARGQGAKTKVTVTGSHFVSGATVTFSAAGITVNSVTFVNATHLSVTITVSSTATVGPGGVTVKNPNHATGSCNGCFTVDLGPVVTSASPSTIARGTTKTITIIGANFQSGAKVKVSGTGVTSGATTFVDANHLQVSVTVSATAPKVFLKVTVTNPDAGKTTNSTCLKVT
jgi:hypothetical protein